MKPEVDTIRSASRQMVRELHLLNGHLCIEGFTFSECHLLMELAALGQATASELGERLILDKSTMSRLVDTLKKRGLLLSTADASDKRRRLLSLSAEGRRGVQKIHRHASRQVDKALDFITPADRQQVVAGLQRYAKALRYARLASDYRLRPMRQRDNPAVARIIREVMTEYGAVGCGFSIEDAEVDAMFESYAGPRSAFYVIEKSGAILGCGGFAPLAGADESVCELRKMYFLPDLRGTGMGTRLLQLILEDARQAGFTLMYLETLDSMSHARRLYEKHGFEVRKSAMGQTGHSACNRFMTRQL